jgi:hypothetical protein
MHPIEAFDLLEALACGSDEVLGSAGSAWRKARQALPLVMGESEPPADELEQWEWLRNPFPPSSEGIDYQILRQSLRMSDGDASAKGSAFDQLSNPDRARLSRLFPRYLENANPILRHIVVRTREYLETNAGSGNR